MNLREISVVVTSSNAGKSMSRCLEPLAGFGEVVVVDAFSTDATLDVARRYRTKIFSRPLESRAAQANWAIERAAKEWVLLLGADESPGEGLIGSLESLEEHAADAYSIRCENEYLGRPIRWCGWRNHAETRLFRRDGARCEDTGLGEDIVVRGRTSRLAGKLARFRYGTVADHFRDVDDRAGREARDYVRRGGRFPVVNMVVRPPFRFLKMYFLQLGVLDGSRGFILCLLSSYGVFLRYAKAWETLYRRPQG